MFFSRLEVLLVMACTQETHTQLEDLLALA